MIRPGQGRLHPVLHLFHLAQFKQELTEYLTELTQSEAKEYLRPNFFPNTPDILPPFCKPAAAGFHDPAGAGRHPGQRLRHLQRLRTVRGDAIPGTEEYLDSEKYQYKLGLERPGNIKDFIARVNPIRRENPALHQLRNLRFYPADDDNVLFYGKSDARRREYDPRGREPRSVRTPRSGLELPLREMGIPRERPTRSTNC